MMKFLFVAAVLFVHCSCRTVQVTRAVQPAQAVLSGSPMSCRVEGKIIRILRKADLDTASACAHYPCFAKVWIAELDHCGSAAYLPLNPGDTIEVRFVYTLHKSSDVFPDMKVQYPGLKEGDNFEAYVEQRLIPGTGGACLVYGYRRK